MLRTLASTAVVLLAAACSRSAPADATDGGASSSSPPSASAAQDASGSRDSGLGFGYGHASSGPGHVTMSVDSRDGPTNSQFGTLFNDLTACYKSSPHRDAHEAVRVSLHVTVGATGTATASATTTIGVLVDKGHNQQGYAYAEEPPKNDAALLTCVEQATKKATVTVPQTFRDASFDVRIELSP
jgi:hypothetical protein